MSNGVIALICVAIVAVVGILAMIKLCQNDK